MKGIRLALGLVAVSAFFLNSCIKQSFDNPPDLTTFDPNLTVNVKLKDLVAPFLGNTAGKNRVLGDSTIYGIVTADDRSGNFYKQIIIQDSTAGMNIAIANTYLYSSYPIGRKVYIKLKGLTLVSYKGNPELCYGLDNLGKPVGIPPTLQDSFIVKASYPHTVTPLEVRLSDLSNTNPYLNLLIKIDNMQVDSASNGGYLNLPYAKPSGVAISTPRFLVSCTGGSTSSVTLELYNSGYADFYNANMPTGYGSITGIFSVYGSASQFQIRDTTDVNFTQPRCH